MLNSTWSILVDSVAKVCSDSVDSVSMKPGVVVEVVPVPGTATPIDTVWVLTVPVEIGAGGARVASATVVIDWVPDRKAPD